MTGVLMAIDQIARASRRRFATRHEIAAALGVSPGDVGEEASQTAGPLGEAIQAGLVQEHPHYRGYWALTETGLTHLDSLIFL
jgi:hypothetical protein